MKQRSRFLSWETNLARTIRPIKKQEDALNRTAAWYSSYVPLEVFDLVSVKVPDPRSDLVDQIMIVRYQGTVP